MKRALNILLVVGCVLSIVAAFVISIKRARTTTALTAPIEPNEFDLSKG